MLYEMVQERSGKNMIKVSVVIPVYNVEAYLRQCLDSVVHQSLKDIEIICVDDGSTDGSPKILEEYSRMDSRIRILRQKNLYAGVARNAGLAAAKGEYVIFWDSDDYFALDALEKLYDRAVAYQADICVCDAQDFDAGSGKNMAHDYLHKPLPESEVFSAQTYKSYIYTFTAPVTWNKLLRREFLLKENIRFQEIKHINDVLGIFTALSCAERIVILQEKLIFYRANREDSLMSTYGKKNDSVFLAYEQLKRDLEERGILQDEEILRSFRNKVLGIYLYTMRYCNTFEQYSAYYRDLVEHRYPCMGMEHLPVGYILNAGDEEKYFCTLESSAEEYLFKQYQKLTVKHSISRQKIVALQENNSKLKKSIDKQNRILQLKLVRLGLCVSRILGKIKFW